MTIQNTQLDPNPLIATMGQNGLPGVLVAAHRRASREAPSDAKSYTIGYTFVDEQGRGVMGPTSSVRTTVRYYGDNSGRTKIERAPAVSSKLVPGAVMVLALMLFVALPATAQGRRNPAGVLEDASYRVDRTVNSVDRLASTLNRLRKRVLPKRPASQCAPSTGNGTTRPRRVCR